jgi:hypothetical protein
MELTMHTRTPSGRFVFLTQRGVGIAAVVWLLFLGSTAVADDISFRNDVMAVLSKAGCNQGTCHGNQNGKNGFKLSLRGQDPEFDHAALTRDTLGRRVNPQRPAESLILLKATAAMPHEGGRRFPVESPEYELLARWIAAGVPLDHSRAPQLTKLEVTPLESILVEPIEQVSLRVQATFSNGRVRDVTRLAVYEPSNQNVTVTPEGTVQRASGIGPGVKETAILVRYLNKQAVVQLAFVPARPDSVGLETPEANFIDRHVFAKLRSLQLQPSDLCSDHVFLRRAYLDLLGLLPTAADARQFLNDPRPDKRARLIDRLLERPEFAEFWALKWSDLLRNEEKTLDRKGVQVLHEWLRRSIADRMPMNELARELVAARGSTYSNPPANFYRALRDPQVRAETVAQVFLGVRLQCAKCHNHPFDNWTQNDYHSLAAFFPRVQYKILENNRKDRLDTHEFDGEQIVWMAREGEVRHPRTGEPMRPLFLGAATPEFGPSADRLQPLADWIAHPDNPFFARTQVNRIWYHLLGRGIVDPLDDFRPSNPPVNKPLFDALTQDFVQQGFDLRHLVRTIMNSRTYQLAAAPNETNREDDSNFSHALIRPLQAEQLLDALAQVTDTPVKFNGYPLGLRAAQIPGVEAVRPRDQRPTAGDQFLRTFGKPVRSLACECERGDDTTLGQAFQLTSGPLLNDLLTHAENRLGRLLSANMADAALVEEFYLTALSRPPTEREQQAGVAYLQRAKDRRAALEDLVWGLVNAKEFLLRQ